MPPRRTVPLREIIAWCDERTERTSFVDFPGALNGLQVENDGKVSRIGAAVDAGLIPFRRAVRARMDLLIVHHGLFWNPLQPLTGPHREKVAVLLAGNCALYSSHLPLDAHPEIGNNARLAREAGLDPERGFLAHEGREIGLIARAGLSRTELKRRLNALFPAGMVAMEFGSTRPARAAILTGSGQSALPHLRDEGVDTFITGELRQNAFNFAQENRLNLYACGHYATETFGVRALAREAAETFGIPWRFIDTACPL